MTKVNSFTKQNLGMVRDEINAALSVVEKKLGIKLDIANICYDRDGSSFKTQLTGIAGQVVDSDGILSDVPAKYIADLKKHKGEAAVKREVEINGKKAIIVGLKNKGLIFKWTPGTPDAQLQPGLRRITYRDGDKLDCLVRGVPYSEDFYKLINHIS